VGPVEGAIEHLSGGPTFEVWLVELEKRFFHGLDAVTYIKDTRKMKV
jgi:hypothetical protein